MIQVKICGLTSYEDAIAAIEAGADLLGFNFYPPSPRSITPDTCRQIVTALGPCTAQVQLVGVFVNRPVEEVEAILDFCGLDLAQLHGDEAPEDVMALNGKAYKALRPRDRQELEKAIERYPSRLDCPAFLIDAYRPGLYGGTGQLGDWSTAQVLASQMPILLAGGLTPENVATAIDQIHPWGVDVASGVESTPGKKDPARLTAFIHGAKG